MRGSRGASVWGIRLLFPLLLLGLVTMHTLGHFASHDPPQALDTPVAAASHESAGHSEYRAPLMPDTPGPPKAAAPMGGMDPASVCVAVLGAWAVGLPAAGCLSRRPADLVAFPGCPAHALRPVSPSGGRMLLNQLSVLRL